VEEDSKELQFFSLQTMIVVVRNRAEREEKHVAQDVGGYALTKCVFECFGAT
jgi:hypothetical protein